VRNRIFGLAIAGLTAFVALGQVPAAPGDRNEAAYEGKPLDGGANRVRLFYLTHGEAREETQEFANVIRTVTEIQRVSVYGDRATIALRGTSNQVALAEWLLNRLDKPVDPQGAKPAAFDTPGSGGAVDAVRVFYFTHDEAGNYEHAANLIRTLADVQRIGWYYPRNAIVLRGTPAQVALTEWIFAEVDKIVTPPVARTEAHEQPGSGGAVDAVRIFFFAHNESNRELDEIVNMIRSMTEVPRICSYPPRRAIALRGTPAQTALAEWLIGEVGGAGSSSIRPK
jgi:hypothetical protein